MEVIIAVLIVVFLVMFLVANIYNKFQVFIIKLNEAEATLDATLRRRFDLLNKSINIIKAHVETDEDILPEIVKLRSRKLSTFELDRSLYDSINEFYSLKTKFPVLTNVEAFTKIEVNISNTEIDMIASRQYYNDITTEYNKLMNKFPSNLVAKILKYKKRNYFDNKDMNDEDIKDFKL